MEKGKLSVGWLDLCHQIHKSHTHRPTNENLHILPSLTFFVLLSLSLSLYLCLCVLASVCARLLGSSVLPTGTICTVS